MGGAGKLIGTILAGAMGVVVFALMAMTMVPLRSQGIVQGIVLSVDVQEGRRGVGTLLNVRLEDGEAAFVAAPRGVMVRAGDHVDLFAMSSDWPWHRAVYQYKDIVRNER